MELMGAQESAGVVEAAAPLQAPFRDMVWIYIPRGVHGYSVRLRNFMSGEKTFR